MGLVIIEKGGKDPTLFVPNLTINLTYLCYGKTKLLVLWEITKKNKEFFDKKKDGKSRIFNIIRWGSNIKKADVTPPSFPKSYHELNLLMLWSSKCMARVFLLKSF